VRLILIKKHGRDFALPEKWFQVQFEKHEIIDQVLTYSKISLQSQLTSYLWNGRTPAGIPDKEATVKGFNQDVGIGTANITALGREFAIGFSQPEISTASYPRRSALTLPIKDCAKSYP